MLSCPIHALAMHAGDGVAADLTVYPRINTLAPDMVLFKLFIQSKEELVGFSSYAGACF